MKKSSIQLKVFRFAWKTRVTKSRKAHIAKVISKIYTAKDFGSHIEISLPENETTSVWMLLICRDFSKIL
jgi:hypothetical protein